MLTGRKYEATLDVAKDKLSNVQIAKKHGISLRTLDLWKAAPEFRAEVERHLNRWREHLEKRGICDRQRRLYRLNDRWRRMQAVIEARAQQYIDAEKPAEGSDPEEIERDQRRRDFLRTVPGGKTGLIVMRQKTAGVEFEVDTGLLAEMRAVEQQAAIEVGQWKPKHEISGPDDGPIPVAMALASVLTIEQLEEVERKMAGTPEPALPPPSETTDEIIPA